MISRHHLRWIMVKPARVHHATTTAEWRSALVYIVCVGWWLIVGSCRMMSESHDHCSKMSHRRKPCYSTTSHVGKPAKLYAPVRHHSEIIDYGKAQYLTVSDIDFSSLILLMSDACDFLIFPVSSPACRFLHDFLDHDIFRKWVSIGSFWRKATTHEMGMKHVGNA
jgi:hypothetical protein